LSNSSATAISNPNIAFIKYWGNCNPDARIPANGSISMNLGGLETRTSVAFDSDLPADRLTLDGVEVSGPALERVSTFLDRVRELAGLRSSARVESANNFPMGAGIASSASAFAALALAAARAAGLDLTERQLSSLARTGSGSACRSVPGGFVEWLVSGCEEDSYAVSIAPTDHWDLADCIAVVSRSHKPVGSTQGHALAYTSPLQSARVADAPRRLETCRSAILNRDFPALAEIIELDSNLMHAVMLTSTPRLIYWQPATLSVMATVAGWRMQGLPAAYTIDAGPNVHVICPGEHTQQVSARLRELPGVEQVLAATVGPAARVTG
jgi:diphosphomevalonate decarboxylase